MSSLVVGGRAAAQVRVELLQCRFAVRVDQDAVDVGECVVAGRAVRLPPCGQFFAVLEDLLDEHVPRSVGSLGALQRGVQLFQIPARVQQTVRVVDPQAVGNPLAHPAEHLRVALLEHPGKLDAQAGERRDGEESAIVQLRRLPPPEHRLPVLPLEDLPEDARVVQRRAAQAHDRERHGVGSERQDVLAAVEPHDAMGAELRHIRIDLHVTLGENHVEGGAEDRHSHPARAEVPVDVERVGVTGVAAVGQDIPPPRVLGGPRDPHVIGDDVDEDAEARRACGRGESVQAVPTSARRVDKRRVDHVVPVLGAFGRPQQR